ncbi:unnamed protein product [Caenorhabditis angaria]|uniref:BTB domain-containing protein n=1 Tax=Caenorhabditis angaria TaxID=860376 RepID=A0A9P1NCN9_9PELO|nr:unnamed protein product [Caenorhabditis angaria]
MTPTPQEFFKTPSNLRTFRISTSTDDLFVNIQFLAEYSEFFNIMLNGEFREKQEMKATIPDVEADDLIDFLSFICPVNYKLNQVITESNIYNLLYFSDRLMCPFIKEHIKKWLIGNEFKAGTYTADVLVNSAVLLHTQGFGGAEMTPVFKKLGSMNLTQVSKTLDIIDPTIKAIFEEKIRVHTPYTFARREPGNQWGDYDYRARIFF